MFKTGNTYRQVVQSVRQAISDKGGISDDSSISSRYILFNMLRFRSKLLNEKINSKSKISKFNYQTIPCIKLEEIDISECPCAPNSGCTFLKAKVKLPSLINGIKSVTSTVGSINYTYVEWDKFKYKLKSRIKANATTPYYTYKTGPDGTYIYLYNDIHKEFISVTGMFDNVIDVQMFPNCEGVTDNCIKPLDLEFIFEPSLFPLLQEMVLRKVFGIYSMNTDSISNDSDDIVNNNTAPNIK